jgi:hypothetical protein
MSAIAQHRVRIGLVAGTVLLILSLALSGYSLATVLSAPSQSVTVPSTVGFEGYLADGYGAPVDDGTYRLRFALYGDQGYINDEEHASVQVTNGLYAVELGLPNGLAAGDFAQAEEIGVTVCTGGDCSGDTEMTPRIKLASVPFALNADEANNADTVDGLHADASAENPRVIVSDSAGSVGIDGDATVGGDLDLTGELAVSGAIGQSTPLGCRVIRGSTQDIPHGVWTPLSFTTDLMDTGDCWSGQEAYKLYARVEGYYMAGASVGFANTAANGQRLIRIDVRGSQSKSLAWTRNDPWYACWNGSVSTGMFHMEVNDYIVVYLYQDTGDELATAAADAGMGQHNAVAWLARIP